MAGFKKHDHYAQQEGHSDNNVSPSTTTIIDPRYEDNDRRLVTPFLDIETAANYLKFLRKKKCAGGL